MTDSNTVIFILGGRQIPLPCAQKSYIFLQSFIANKWFLLSTDAKSKGPFLYQQMSTESCLCFRPGAQSGVTVIVRHSRQGFTYHDLLGSIPGKTLLREWKGHVHGEKGGRQIFKENFLNLV